MASYVSKSLHETWWMGEINGWESATAEPGIWYGCGFDLFTSDCPFVKSVRVINGVRLDGATVEKVGIN